MCVSSWRGGSPCCPTTRIRKTRGNTSWVELRDRAPPPCWTGTGRKRGKAMVAPRDSEALSVYLSEASETLRRCTESRLERERSGNHSQGRCWSNHHQQGAHLHHRRFQMGKTKRSKVLQFLPSILLNCSDAPNHFYTLPSEYFYMYSFFFLFSDATENSWVYRVRTRTWSCSHDLWAHGKN